MQTIILRSIPFKDVIKDLAEKFEVDYTKSCHVYSIEIPESYGKGHIIGMNFEEGVGLLMYDCLFYQDLELQFIVNEVHPLKFMFCEEGDFNHRFQSSEEDHPVEELQNIIVASNQNKGHILQFKANVRTKINNLEVNRKIFYDGMACEIESLKPGLQSLFTDVEGRNFFYQMGSYSLRAAEIFSEINQFEGTPFQYSLLIHSQTYRIFLLQILEYWDAQSPEESQSILLKRELNLIQEAASKIDTDIVNFQSVQALAREVGLNPNKLQNGFKEIYGTTVNGYVQKARLTIASILIKNTDHSFAEIADKVGISSKSYFSKIFKDKYGLTPSEIKKKC